MSNSSPNKRSYQEPNECPPSYEEAVQLSFRKLLEIQKASNRSIEYPMVDVEMSQEYPLAFTINIPEETRFRREDEEQNQIENEKQKCKGICQCICIVVVIEVTMISLLLHFMFTLY